MPFQEKSAFIMLVGLLITGVFYLATVVSLSGDGQLARPNLPVLMVYTAILTMIAIVGHIVIAAFSAKEANAKLDERERRIFDRAGHLSSHVFSAGIILSLLLYLFSYTGDVLFYTVFGSLIIGQVVEYLMQIYFYRMSIT